MKENVMNGKALWIANGEKAVQERKPAGCGQAARRALRTAGAIVGAVLLIGVMVAPVWAQAYPNKPIRFIVPFAPGGGTDILARIIGSKLSERFGQPVVIENRAAGGGHVGYAFTAKARPDGHTIVICAPGLSLGPSLYKTLTYDPGKDLAPISLVAQGHQVLLVQLSLPVKNLKELVAYAKARPGKVHFGSSGVATAPHLAGELFNSLAKINTVHVPFKGAGPSLIGLMAGDVEMVVMAVPVALPQIEAGKVRPLAVLSRTRAPSLPNVPTAKEAGIDDFEAPLWYGILAPAETPRDIVNRLSAEWIKIAAMPDVVESIQKAGFEPLSGTPEQFSEFFKEDIARWGKVIKDAGIPTLD
jgi:tripartite-type tricarboxylate transporter receptor subunit TctC